MAAFFISNIYMSSLYEFGTTGTTLINAVSTTATFVTFRLLIALTQ
ncbi:hypothetical protein FQV37_2755 [Psychrobacter nivimaris]|uniref:Uncharacterized protein n=1 Tax=Psychrobacter nivimaris TaxID=281738 RepID=A0A6N7C411_9GAMM|nr:hypothetical protein FQV37_2755 [Psychrobacter nivimaris]